MAEMTQSSSGCCLGARVRRFSLRADWRGKKWDAAQRHFGIGAAEHRPVAGGTELSSVAEDNGSSQIDLIDRDITRWAFGASGPRGECGSLDRPLAAPGWLQ
jgi:hypothetical protein